MLSKDIVTTVAHGAMSEFLLIDGVAQGIVGSLWVTDAAEPPTTMIGVEVVGAGAAAAGAGVGVAATTTTAEAAGIIAVAGITAAATGAEEAGITAAATGAEEAGVVVGENTTEIGVGAEGPVVVPPVVRPAGEGPPGWAGPLEAAADLRVWGARPVAADLRAWEGLLVAVEPPVVAAVTDAKP